MAIRLHGGTLPVEPKGDRYLCRFELVFVETNAAGKQPGGVQDTADFELTNETLHRALEAGLGYRKALKIHPDAAAIRVVARSVTTGALGSVRIPVTPSPSAPLPSVGDRGL